MSTVLARAALAYAEAGLYVFPLIAGGKTPRLPGGVHGASQEAKIVRKWWEKYPDSNIGIALRKSGLGCIDLDVKPAKGVDGRSVYRSLVLFYGDPTRSLCRQVTPSSGEHILFRCQAGVTDRVAWGKAEHGDGVDILTAAHRYIVAAPSVIEGRAGAYAWTNGDPRVHGSPAGLSKDWAELLKAVQPERHKNEDVACALLDDDTDAALDAAALRMPGVTLAELDAVLEVLDPSVDRDGWLRILWGAAAQWGGTKDEDAVIEKLEKWSSKTDKPGQYKRGEVSARWQEHSSKSGGRSGAGHTTWRSIRSLARQNGWSPFSLGGITAKDWKTHLDIATVESDDGTSRRVVKPNAWNASLFLSFGKSLSGSVRKNMLTMTVEMHKHEICPLRDPTRLPAVWDKDADWPGVGKALKGLVHGDLTQNAVVTAVRAASQVHAYDPMKDFVDALVWDGEKRLDKWLPFVTNCEDNELMRAIGRAWMIGLAARATTDYDGKGTKMDSVLVLQGSEGIGKSTIGAIIGGDWYASFSDSLKDDNVLYTIERSMVLEFEELDSMSRSEASRVKALVTTQADTFRRKYGEVATSRPRRCVFIGTTNDDQFLSKDMTVRRWWVVRCGKQACRLNWLRNNRDQLIAEAKAMLDCGELPVLPPDLHAEHRKQVQTVQMEHPYEDAVREWTRKQPVGTKMTAREAVEGAMGRASTSLTMTELRKFGEIMRQMGWEKKHSERGNKWVRIG